MAGDNRGPSSLFRRAEQLRRWQESETNKQEVNDKVKKRKVKFSDGCIFLAASAAGDKDELERLLEKGADINTVNQDGITALHAACIDNNLEIVEFLVDSNADINRCDMEGWTPLHATASCGSISMAEFLISRGADLSVVNNDGELAIDVADEEDMAKLLQEEMDRRGIDSDASRSREERHMLEDAQFWLNNGNINENPHPKTGASALHVASAKGYIPVLRILIESGADVQAKDLDGWTPLHAAAHWRQTEAVEILCDNMADMDVLNSVGQSPYDLADDSLKCLMDELRRKQKLLNKVISKKRKTSPHKDRSNKKDRDSQRGESDGMSSSSSDESTSHDVEKRTSNRDGTLLDHTEVQSWRRPSLRNKILNERRNSKEDSIKPLSNVSPPIHVNNKDDEVILRKDSTSNKEDRNCQDILKIQDNNYVTTSNSIISTSPSKHNSSVLSSKANGSIPPPPKNVPSILLSPNPDPPSPTGPTVSTSSKMTAGSVIKNFFNLLHSSRSFVPPSRDDESETQRKAHAKLVRSTRRSTQGITLEDVKSAEQFMKTKQVNPTSTATDSTPTSTTMTTTTLVSITPSGASDLANSSSDTNTSNSASNKDSSFSLESPLTKDNSRLEIENEVETTTITLPLRKKSISDDKKEDKLDDKGATTREGTQAVIQRRKKAKRRSTGVVHVDIEDIDPDKKENKDEEKEVVSVSEREGSSSKTSSQSNSRPASRSSSVVGSHNGDIDYKKLYEEQLSENDKLMERLRNHERELRVAKETIDNNSKAVNARSLMAETERREKRSLERKLSEMEEELRQLQKLKAENEKLRAENRALTRVVSKLTNSATAMSNFARK